MNLRWATVVLLGLALLDLPGVQEAHAAGGARGPHDNPLLRFGGLVRICERSDATATAACAAYIAGYVAGSAAALDAAVVHRVAKDVAAGLIAPTDSAIAAAVAKYQDESRMFCIRSSWTPDYVMAIAVQYGREHPEALGEMTSEHMPKIMERAFPCHVGR